MTEAARKQIKASILEQIDALENDLQLLREATAPIAPDNAIGRISRMDAITNKAIAQAAQADKQRMLQELEQALAKVDTPSFGLCTRCGNSIALERLIYLPHSPYCVRCASQGLR